MNAKENLSPTVRSEAPVAGPEQKEIWGSDAIAAVLRTLDIPFLALNPGASYRGLHDSIVNYLGNARPEMVLCLHEESAIAIAQGYAKVSGRMMGAVVHSNVGLMHASMAIFNAWCDRVPMLVLGATGPWDAAKRRPWIDWIHTASDQAALVRDYTKWDNQPASVPAAYEAILRAAQIANTAPRGPTYVNLDAGLQEAKIGALPPLPDAKRYRAPDPVLSADWVDLAGALKEAWGADPVGAKVIKVSPDAHIHRGWSMDYQGLPVVDLYMMCEPDAVVPLLLDAVKPRPGAIAAKAAPLPDAAPDVVSIRTLADALNVATRDMEVCITRLPLGWNGAYRHFRHPLDYIGSEGGGGVGAGPGITVGAALALKDSGRLPVAIMGDGDFLMGATALWTAAHYGVPCLILVANNRSFFNDELHQERVAKERSRPVENRWIGQRISGPDIDIAMMARAQGAEGIGPVAKAAELRLAIEKGIQAARNGAVCVVDVRVAPGYDTNMGGSGASQKRLA